MTYEPPSHTWQLKAGELAGNTNTPYLFKGVDDDDSQWNVVARTPICRMMPTPDRDGFMPPEVTVLFTDGAERVFNPDDQVLIGPTIRD